MSNNDPFKIIGDNQVPEKKGLPVMEEDKTGELKDRIERLINSANVFLFMKGEPNTPQCGFSANVIEILNRMSCNYRTFDILTDPDIRQGVKEYANWPTFPQLWVKGQLVGGNDIVAEMYQSGDLEKVLS